MRVSALLLFVWSLSGCAIAQGLDGWQNERTQRLTADAAEKKDKAERAETVREYKKNLHPGLLMKDVTSAIGEPNRTEFTASQTTHWYDGKHPFWLVYDSGGVLQEKIFDTASAARKKSDAAAAEKRRRQSYEDLANASSQLGRAISGANNQAPVQSKRTDFACFNQCTSAGSDYGFCHSKCDY